MIFKPVDPKPNFSQKEEEILAFWKKHNIFELSQQKNQGKQPFVFFEGPPTANGKPGLHHVEARSFKDIILRFQTMRGRYVVRRAGWDTHGLPVELEVEKALGISGKKQIENIVPGKVRASIEKFNQLCRESDWKYREIWEQFTERMGFWIDLKAPYVTYENAYIESVWWLLKQIWEREVDGKPLVYEGHKVVPYCPRCGTAVSSHEVAQGYEQVTENSVFIAFRLAEVQLTQILDEEHKAAVRSDIPTYLVSWTTTPWTLPGNVALAVGPAIAYAFISTKEANYIVSQSQVDHIFDSSYTVVATMPGSKLVGLTYEPLFKVPELATDTSYQVYPAEFVTENDGTGIVHTAVMYGEDDYMLGEKLGLRKFHTVTEEGTFIAAIKGLAGLPVKSEEAEKRILAELKKKGAIVRTESYTHDYPFCWRCKTPLLYYARTSWFIRMSALRKQLQKNNEQINWVPEYIKHGRFGGWLEDAKDWAISRERYWGTPLPIWKCTQCNDVLIIGSIDELQSKSINFQITNNNSQTNSKSEIPNSEAKKLQATSYKLDELDLHRPYIDDVVLKCSKCNGEMQRIKEVLDVWFDSGAMPYAQWHYPFENKDIFREQFPADYISEAIDQTRGWFYTLLAIATALGAEIPPFRNVVNLGHVLDAEGRKMSKSKGNIVEPMRLAERYGMDIVRWYIYTTNQPGDPKRFDESELTRLQRKVQTILWNVYNYFLTYAKSAHWQPQGVARSAPINELDEWIMLRRDDLVSKVTKYLEAFDMFHAARVIEAFIEDLSTWYLRRSRGLVDHEFFAVLHQVLLDMASVIAPF